MTVTVPAALVVVLGTAVALACGAGLLLLWQAHQRQADTPTEAQSETAAVQAAFLACGLNIDLCQPDFDLSRTGKAHEVLDYAARVLGRNNPLRTVQDVIEVLRTPQ